MRIRIAVLTFACLLSCRTAIADEQRSDSLTADAAAELLEELTPPADEPWRSIPWKIDVLDGQRTASAENKPLFIWAMDGHPLGCT
ncbi:MAG TPA: hypothetical protein DCG12_10675 [Planctomycetaceae bacterium]|nr:hypothetical protein [Planctomycetaceae bacterium]|tara:strand:+ start:104 stop:361 length:258 start_codon:yes stop_codon:yes gene_type:complete